MSRYFRWLASLVLSTVACGHPAPTTDVATAPPASCVAATRPEEVWARSDLDRPLHIHKAGPLPHSPPECRNTGCNAGAVLDLIILATGKVDPCSIRIVWAIPTDYGPSAAATFAATVYDPPLRHGVPVAVQIRDSLMMEVRIKPLVPAGA